MDYENQEYRYPSNNVLGVLAGILVQRRRALVAIYQYDRASHGVS
jgi:hypothetical protein